MNTCGTCKFFGPSISDEDQAVEELPTKYHRCTLLGHLNDYRRRGNAVERVAGVVDGSGYHAALCVTEEFGCNQWQPTDERTL